MKPTRLLSALAVVTIALLTGLLCDLGAQAAGKGKPGGGDGEEDIDVAFAYADTDPKSNAIFVTTIDGATTRQLTSPKRRTKDRSPTWSPDLDLQTPGYQGLIAYLHWPDAYTNQLYVINPEGTGRQLVRSFGPFPDPVPADHSPGKTNLAWSPNGREIIFNDSGDALYSVEVATGNVRLLMGRLFANRQIDDPAVSPLGMLAFETDGDIYVVDYQLDADGLIQVDATTATNITGNALDIVETHPSWSPDGTQLAFIRFPQYSSGTEFQQLVVFDGLLDQFTLVLEEPEPLLSTVDATWSPDGSQIAIHGWSTTARGEKDWDIVRITNWDDPDNRQFINVTRTDHAVEGWPVWSPGWTEKE